MNKNVLTNSMKERNIKVNAGQTTSFLWEGENVFSTPSMIAEMEETCRLLLKEQFLQDEEWDSVGTLVNVKHLKATPVGTEVRLKVEVIEVDEKRITFAVKAEDRLEKIGEGSHERIIINIPKFRDKFNKKLKKLEML